MYFQAHGADASEVGKGTGSCFHAAMSVFSRVVLKTLMSGPRHQGVKCFRARSQSAMVLFSCKTRKAVRHVDCSDGEGRISKTAVSRRHHSRVQMKAICSIKQLRHSSNVGGATQHNGWHRSTGHIADTVEVSNSSRISRPCAR